MSILFRRVSLPYGPPTGVVDVRVDDAAVTAVGVHLPATGVDEVVHGRGGALIPGLHDHHIHLHALAASTWSVRCGPPQVTSADGLAAALDAAGADQAGWVRGVGYVETVAGLLDSTRLDRLHARRPVRLQHRSGAVWFLNSAAAERVGLATADHPGVERDESGAPTGRVWRADDWLRDRLGRAAPPDLSSVGTSLARHGITGVTDATPDLDADALRDLVEAHTRGAVPQRLHLLGAPTADLPATVGAGPVKIVLADSDLPDFDVLCDRIGTAHDAGRGVAVHSVTRESLILLLAALDEVGAHPDDRVEHGAIIAADTVGELRRRRLTVVTQPGFLADRGDDFLDRLDAADVPDLYRCRSLVDHDVPLAMSSDAPYGPVDPWAVVDAAATRRAPDGRIIGEDERIDRTTALARYLAPLAQPGGAPRTVHAGAPADLVLLDGALHDALARGSEAVRHTVIGGRTVYRRAD
ncbi:amidohydrolase family protein [Gordonia aurantiaca]|uniref:amidohydrolase family protein n=1 Tax=Gordonia sp. B21 TaxID=3151852 RepID=UPI0032639BB1